MAAVPACYWCSEAIESYDLKMGEVKVVRRGHSRSHDSFDIFDARDEEWEEEWIEKRPFHLRCWEDYRRRR